TGRISKSFGCRTRGRSSRRDAPTNLTVHLLMQPNADQVIYGVPCASAQRCLDLGLGRWGRAHLQTAHRLPDEASIQEIVLDVVDIPRVSLLRPDGGLVLGVAINDR